jgi:hypothetical protein
LYGLFPVNGPLTGLGITPTKVGYFRQPTGDSTASVISVK